MMLVLTRTLGEEVVIGTNVAIKVVAVSGKSVKIGICAPKDVAIRRSEIAPHAEVRPVHEEISRRHVPTVDKAAVPAFRNTGSEVGPLANSHDSSVLRGCVDPFAMINPANPPS